MEFTKKSDGTLKIQPEIKGNTSGFTYKYVWQKDNWKEWGIIKDFSSSSSVEWEPKTSGTYTMIVDVKDANGKVVTKQTQYTIK